MPDRYMSERTVTDVSLVADFLWQPELKAPERLERSSLPQRVISSMHEKPRPRRAQRTNSGRTIFCGRKVAFQKMYLAYRYYRREICIQMRVGDA